MLREQGAGDRGPGGQLSLWYARPAGQWVEALPVGNGRIAAMVFGRVRQERLQLNIDSLHAGGPYDPNNPAAAEALPRVRALIAAERYREAGELVSSAVIARPASQMPYGSAGDLLLDFHGLDGADDFRRSLDLDTAIAATRFSSAGASHVREVFASVPDGVIVVRLLASGGTLDFDLAYWHPRDAAYGDIRRGGREPAASAPAGAIGATWDFTEAPDADPRPAAPAVGPDGPQALLVEGRNIASSGIPGAHTASCSRACRCGSAAQRRAACSAPTDARIAAAEQAADAELGAMGALYVQYGRYLLLSSSRPGGHPANLQGIWNEGNNPPWGSKYTININTEMNYWPAEPANLAVCVEPVLRMVEELAQIGAVTARGTYGARGWVAHHNTDLWRASAPIDGPNWGMWPCGGAWLCKILWDRWDYGRDPAWLRRIYPLLWGAALFFIDTLVEDPGGRGLVTSPSISPENEHHPGVALCAGPAMDRQIVRDLLAWTLAAQRELSDTDAAFATALARTRARLAPDRIGAQGQLQEWLEDWDAGAPEPRHRHVSHLYAVYRATRSTCATRLRWLPRRR